MEKDLDYYLELILNGKISIRQASKESGFGRDFLKNKLLEKYSGNSEKLKQIEKVLEKNKAKSTEIRNR